MFFVHIQLCIQFSQPCRFLCQFFFLRKGLFHFCLRCRLLLQQILQSVFCIGNALIKTGQQVVQSGDIAVRVGTKCHRINRLAFQHRLLLVPDRFIAHRKLKAAVLAQHNWLCVGKFFCRQNQPFTGSLFVIEHHALDGHPAEVFLVLRMGRSRFRIGFQCGNMRSLLLNICRELRQQFVFQTIFLALMVSFQNFQLSHLHIKVHLFLNQRVSGTQRLGGKTGRVLAVLFAAFCALASFGIGNLSQLNSIAGNLKAAFGVPETATGAVLAAVSAVILLGGLKRVAAVAERLVPAMALLYIVGALTVVAVHITAVPAALAAILKGAFGLRAAGGGIVGYGLSRAVTWGFKRGAFSNEAGLGSSVMVHAASNVKEPVQQGMWGIFEVFADTMVVCTLTALVVLTSGFVDLDTGRIAAGAAGSALVGQAFDAVFGTLGSKLIAVCILLFAYSTTLGWSCYGCKAVEYLFGAGAGAGYRVLFVALMPMGAVMRLDLAWTLSDTFNGLMMLPNLIGVIALSGTVVRITQNYLDRRLYGSHAPPLLSAGETI